MSDQASRVATALRRHVDPGPGETPKAARRARFVDEAMRIGPPQSRQGARIAVVAFAAVVLSVGGYRMLAEGRANHVEQAALTYEVGDKVGPGHVGDYFAPRQELPLRFSDGSEVTLLGDARARVTASSRAGASVLLETGTARVEVVHRPDSAWTFATGPFTVSVTGTSFALTWEPVSGTLDVKMFSGTVVVRGPGAESGVPVHDAKRFLSRPGTDPMSHEQAIVQGQAGDRPEAREFAEPSDGDEKAAGSAASTEAAKGAAATEREKWSQLAARGAYRRIMELAQARGIESALATGDLSELGALADAAKYTGHVDIAKRALLTTRSRFAKTPRSVAAAFLLGRILDDGGSPASAIQWYDRYLAEGPDGSFAPEAFGRRMLALRRAGEEEASRQAAREYVKRFPGGAYAGIAHEIAGR